MMKSTLGIDVERLVRTALLLTTTAVFATTTMSPACVAERQQKAKVIITNDTPYNMKLYVYGISWGSVKRKTKRTIFVPEGNPSIQAYFDLGYDANGKPIHKLLENSRQLRAGRVYTWKYSNRKQ